VDTITISPEGHEFEIDSQNNAKLMFKIFQKQPDGLLNCVFNVNIYTLIEVVC
jgi:hypothetical protein